MENAVVLVGDSVSANKSTANKQNISLIGCASYRFNLAVSDIICIHEEVLGKLHTQMVKLKKPLQRAKLNKETDLLPVFQNDTSWISTYKMLF